MTLYENGIVRVRTTFWGAFRIDHKLKGVTIKPEQRLAIQAGLIWKTLRSKKYKSMSPPDGSAEDLFMQTFAACALQPDGEMAIRFRGDDVEAIAWEMVSEANINHVAKKLL